MSYDDNGFLNCTELRYFWVSWTDGLISVGFGADIGSDVIVEYIDTSPYPVAALSFTTGNNNKGIFEFPKTWGMFTLQLDQ